MARKLNFLIEDLPFEFAIEKVDRNKLYGSREISVVNQEQETLHKGYLDEWGSVLIASSGMGYVDSDKNWYSKADLIPVDGLNRPMTLLPSSFDKPVEIKALISYEDYLTYEISTVYILRGLYQERMLDKLNKVDGFYAFDFVYRSSYESKTAFLIPSSKDLYLAIGQQAELEYLGKPQKVELEASFEEEESDDLDFSMM